MISDARHARGHARDPDRVALAAWLRCALGALLLVLGSLPQTGMAEGGPGGGGWQLAGASEDGSVRVYLRDNEAGYREFRGVTRVRSTLGGLIALFSDVERMPEWIYRTMEVRRLKVAKETDLIVYTVNELPWPLFDRDATLHVLVEQEPASQVVSIRVNGVAGQHPERPDRVRMPLVVAEWKLTPVGGGMVEVSFRGYGDPGGSLATPLFRWFYRRALWKAPLETLAALRRRVGRREYQESHFGFIQEPP